MEEESVILSIVVPTYGHEKYIAQALDSILMQKTKYSFEVLVGEDASFDNTKQILKEYEEKYPGRFQMFYREVNMRKLNASNCLDLKLKARGKYLMTLEGDDYWLSEDKIEKQITFLEEHPEYIAVAHNCLVVDDNSKASGEQYPECKEKEYTLKHFLYNILPGQTATVMCRNYFKYQLFDTAILKKGLIPGDKLLYFALVTHGKVYCMQEVMSAYRHVSSGGSSYSANIKYKFFDQEKWYKELLNYAYSLKDVTSAKYIETLYFSNVLKGHRKKDISLLDIIKYYRKLKYKVSIIFLYSKVWLNYRQIHKNNINRPYIGF